MRAAIAGSTLFRLQESDRDRHVPAFGDWRRGSDRGIGDGVWGRRRFLHRTAALRPDAAGAGRVAHQVGDALEDRARRDEDGYYWFVGRADDIIKTSGHMVGPFEVESALMEHPAVGEAAVIGKPDPLRGEIIKAFIALREGYQPSDELIKEIQEFVKKGLAAHAAPREIEFRDKLPKTMIGKLSKKELMAEEEKRRASA